MIVSILTLFPDMFIGPFDASIIKRAKEKGIADIHYINIRDFAEDAYKTVDDHPYGGGAGMILRVDVVDRALRSVIPGLTRDPSIKSSSSTMDPRFRGDDKIRTVLLDPQGTPYTQAKARELSRMDHLILICGHYEGVDERIRSLVDEEISIGDYVLTGGEIPAMAIVDSVVRLLPGVLKKEEATIQESFSQGTLEYPQYTRPEIYKDMKVPDILLSGDHKKIEAWKKEQSLQTTRHKRPDLI